MYKNYLKIAWRNLIKDKTFTLLNIMGLSVAFGVAILLVMSAFFDLSYDNFHTNGERIYKVYAAQQTPKGPQAGTSRPEPFAKALQAEVPGVEKIVRYLQNAAFTLYQDKEINVNAIWVDPDFFSMFTYKVLSGNKNDPLREKSSVVITQKTASKLFGAADAVGKTINVLIDGVEKPFTISSVVENNPNNSSFEFEMVFPFENHSGFMKNKDNWSAKYHSVYVQLQEGLAKDQFEKSTEAFVNLHYKEDIENLKRDGALPDAGGHYFKLCLLPLKDIHFTSFGKGHAEVSRNVPYFIIGIALLILFIACVNFINMSVAKSSRRLKEIGMRKTLGAQKKQLFFQFWSESLLMFLAAVVTGIVLSALLINDFKTIFNTQISMDMLISPWVVLGFSISVLTITLLVGGYPAILLSRLGTIRSLKGKLENSGKNRVRNVLMTLQFGIAILLISGTLVLWGQIDYMRNKDLGYNKSQVISFPLTGKRNGYDVVQLLREKLRSNPDVLSISAANNNLGRGKDGTISNSVWGFEYKGRIVNTHGLTVDYDYIKTLDLQLVSGRDFDVDRKGDTQNVIINESMAKELGEENPLSTNLPFSDSLGHTIIGVVKDYNFQELSKPIQPLTFFLDREQGLSYVYAKVAPTNMANSFNAVKEAYAQIEPNANFLGSFLDENVDRTFKREKTMATMVTSGSIIAIALSCVGLFAMSLLIVAQRTKEIGVRKVLGASVSSITVLLTKDFIKLVLIAFLIASPIAWWFLKQWLANYAYRIDLGIWFFIAAGALAIIIALVTVGTRTIKAAMQNPVKSLRTE